MPRKRKKFPKLPNGFGSIRYLGSGRRRPYAAFPPVTSYTEKGIAKQPHPLGYAEDYYGAYDLLFAYHNGSAPAQLPAGYKPQRITFSEIYERFYHEKYEDDKSRVYSESSKSLARAAYKNCSVLHDRAFVELRYDDLQAVIDDCPLKYASLETICSLLHQMYKYAIKHDIVEKDCSQYLQIKRPDDDEHGIPFTDKDIKTLWQHSDDETAAMLLIMIYSGFRISAYSTLEINTKEWYFKGGVKTAASKNRIVPIHTAIRPLVTRKTRKGKLFDYTSDQFRRLMTDCLDSLGIDRHTPHDCRHTFSRLCEAYGVRENDRKRLLGHAFSKDITNEVYGHRTVEDLRAEIEKIKIPGAD